MKAVQSERRRAPRKPAAIAVEIDAGPRKARVGVTRDTSETGALMATPSRFEIGDELHLTLFFEDKTVNVKGKVVRLETNPPTSTELWRYRLAVTFDEPISDLTPRLSP